MSDQEWFDDDPTSARLDVELWKRILSHAKPYRGPLWGLAGSGLVIASVDVALPWVTGKIIDDAIGNGGRLLAPFVATYAGLAMVFAALVWFFIGMAGRTTTGFAHDVRREGFRKLQELSFAFYDKHSVGWLMARLTSDISKVSGVIPWTALDVVWGTSLIVGVSITMVVINWQLGLMVVAIIPPLAWLSLIFQKKLLASQRKVRRANSKLTASFNEGIMGVRTTKALVREKKNLSEFQELSTDMYGHSVQNALQSAVYLPIVMSVGSIGVGLALWQGGVRIGPGGMTVGEMIMFMNYAGLFFMPVQELAARFTQLQAAQASAERIQRLLDTKSEVVDSESAKQAMAAHADLEARGLVAPELAPDGLPDLIEEIEYRDVSFQYKEGELVLDRVSFRARQGETVALVGATGSGKSTIVSLLSRFYEPTDGEILVDGVEYRERSLDWWQSNFGVVLQSPHLFGGTIADNIRYGRLDASDGDVESAARRVGAHDFIEALEKGYATEVGEGGSRLSTGQKQLVSLARAVLSDPQVFVMDEATSSVDTETEQIIQSGIETILEGRISFVIAHRLSTVRNADQILVLDHGRIVEAGSHAELLRLRGRYFGLYTNQATRESAERVFEMES